eukprot:954897-Pelagomonas_calceolata.AAC.5
MNVKESAPYQYKVSLNVINKSTPALLPALQNSAHCIAVDVTNRCLSAVRWCCKCAWTIASPEHIMCGRSASVMYENSLKRVCLQAEVFRDVFIIESTPAQGGSGGYKGTWVCPWTIASPKHIVCRKSVPCRHGDVQNQFSFHGVLFWDV